MGYYIYSVKNAWTYSLLVWITSALVAPVVCNLIGYMDGSEMKSRYLADAFGLIGVEMLVALCFSFISFLVLFIFTYMFIKQSFVEARVKVYLTIIGLVLTAGPLLFSFGSARAYQVHSFAFLRFIIYPIITAGCIWFYKLNRVSA